MSQSKIVKARPKKDANPMSIESRNRTRAKIAFHNEQALSFLLGDIEELKKLDPKKHCHRRRRSVYCALEIL